MQPLIGAPLSHTASLFGWTPLNPELACSITSVGRSLMPNLNEALFHETSLFSARFCPAKKPWLDIAWCVTLLFNRQSLVVSVLQTGPIGPEPPQHLIVTYPLLGKSHYGCTPGHLPSVQRLASLG